MAWFTTSMTAAAAPSTVKPRGFANFSFMAASASAKVICISPPRRELASKLPRIKLQSVTVGSVPPRP